MADELTERFINALEKLETDGDLETIAGLFDANCEIGNVTLSETFRGPDAARKFWTNYHETLGRVRSKFRNKIVNDKTTALEWRTEGSANDHEINYEGVSILETNGEKITRFFAYFDPGKLGRQMEVRNG